jgi:hypothetical protein
MLGYIGHCSVFFLWPKNRSSRLALLVKQQAPKTKAVDRLTFVCNQPAIVGPMLKPILHVTE